jgi:hypothetical protein
MTKSYGIGYKKPPKKSQFKPGQSGNAKGRPKGSKNFASELSEELMEKIAIKEDGKKKSISKQRALVKALLAKALQGNAQAANVLINAALKLQESIAPAELEDWAAEDEAIVKEYIERTLALAKKKKGAKS